MLMRVGEMWTYGGQYHSFVTNIHAIFRFYLTFKLTAYVFFLQYDFVLYFWSTLVQDKTSKKKGSGKCFKSFQILY